MIKKFNNLKLELFIAKRYLITKHKEAFVGIINAFALTGITLGVATLIIVMSVMNGYEKELLKKILEFKGHITVTTQDMKMKNWPDVLNAIQNVKHISFIAPVIEKQALAMTDINTSGVLIKGMLPNDIKKKLNIEENLQNGEVILGATLAQNLGTQQSDSVKVITPQFNQSIFGSMPRMKTYSVATTFDCGMYEYNSSGVFMTLEDAQLLFKMQNYVSGIEITLEDVNNLLHVKREIIKILRKNNFDNSLMVIDWKESNKTLVEALTVERNVMFLILSLIVMIASFNIISSLILLVKDKSKSIAILQTIGMTKYAVMRVFIFCGLTLGVVGTALGITLGTLFSLNIERIRTFLESLIGIKMFDPMIYFLMTLPSDFNLKQIIYIGLMSIILSFLATIYPVMRIAKISPANVLRY